MFGRQLLCGGALVFQSGQVLVVGRTQKVSKRIQAVVSGDEVLGGPRYGEVVEEGDVAAPGPVLRFADRCVEHPARGVVFLVQHGILAGPGVLAPLPHPYARVGPRRGGGHDHGRVQPHAQLSFDELPLVSRPAPEDLERAEAARHVVRFAALERGQHTLTG
ncbi:MAG: hypothetical protein AMK73_05110 [Planctomycetes bacterium SM23_32]|nr:MAG: hypothetical protein AMK73_05110 [Planctomycetes bacterium SM23_32]